MKICRLILYSVLLLLSVQTVKAQYCYKYHLERACTSKSRDDFRFYGQSRSALLEVDSASTLSVLFYGNKDYIVTVCAEKGFYPIHFIIRNTETGRIFYDNMEDEYIESVGFTIDHPQKLEIDVTLIPDKNDIKDFEDSQACVGVFIEWRRTGKLGFQN